MFKKKLFFHKFESGYNGLPMDLEVHKPGYFLNPEPGWNRFRVLSGFLPGLNRFGQVFSGFRVGSCPVLDRVKWNWFRWVRVGYGSYPVLSVEPGTG